MTVVLKSIGDVTSQEVHYHTFVGSDRKNLTLTYDWFIEKRDYGMGEQGLEKCDYGLGEFYFLVRKDLSQEGFFFGDAGLCRNPLESATTELYARAWIDCMTIDPTFQDKTKNNLRLRKKQFEAVVAEYEYSNGLFDSPNGFVDSPIAGELQKKYHL